MTVNKIRTVVAWILLCGSLIGWPLSAMTVAKHEPQFILGLSWVAITLTCADLLTTSQHKRNDEDD